MQISTESIGFAVKKRRFHRQKPPFSGSRSIGFSISFHRFLEKAVQIVADMGAFPMILERRKQGHISLFRFSETACYYELLRQKR